MSDENPHIQTLKSAREVMVEKRREQAKTMSDRAFERPEGFAGAFRDLQDAIEAIDRAIADEDKIDEPRRTGEWLESAGNRGYF